jgi:hypothetical protein
MDPVATRLVTFIFHFQEPEKNEGTEQNEQLEFWCQRK